MLMMAKSILDLNKVPDINLLFDKIDQVDAHQLMELAQESFDFNKLSMLSFHPELN